MYILLQVLIQANIRARRWGAIQWGGGSCFINAGLQFLFSSIAVKQALATWVSERAHSVLRRQREKGRDLWSLTTLSTLLEIKSAPIRPAASSWDARLALTFAAAVQGKSLSGDSLRGKSLIPALETCVEKHTPALQVNCLS